MTFDYSKLSLSKGQFAAKRAFEVAKVAGNAIMFVSSQMNQDEISEVRRDIINLHGTIDPVKLPAMLIELTRPEFESIFNNREEEDSKTIHIRISAAKAFLPKVTPKIDGDGLALLERAYKALSLPINTLERICAVAAASAALDSSESILAEHVAEAIQYFRLHSPVESE